ncbi:MAG: hypothetical protein JWR61_4438 [Ferruginibacter sp.]|uniref:Yip1 family protein n=1 Tax=Ferruginibacter sp. TaxID=1940288 RepID=UPI00265B27A6|nr:Yip1 family protein [Ferruginibacter sp.]MDB5279483.1 hypothetical protein [Ferruginibacter sp.]
MKLIERIKNMIATPKTEWQTINTQPETLPSVLSTYVLPLALAGAVAIFIGYSFIGMDYGFFRMRGMEWGIKMALLRFISALIVVILTTYILDALAPSFSSEKNIDKSAQLVAYSCTPAFAGTLLSIIPSLAWLGGVFGLYGFYLMYLGLGLLKKTPEDKKVIYLVVTIVVMIILYALVGVVLGMVMRTNLNALNNTA